MLNEDKYSFLINKARLLYEKSKSDTLEAFPQEIRNEFYKNGNRSNFEKLYFCRRDYLSSVAVLALSDDTYIPELQKIILAVCNEYCWALPAHTPGVETEDKKVLDLFVAETSFAIAEICYVLKEKISPEVYGRVRQEIRNRLLSNYTDGSFWWESCNMNWAAVCGGYVGGALLYLFPDEFAGQKSRILKTLDCYIDGFTEDGFCLEGPSYWQYGFMAYTVFADLLYKFSGGKYDLFRSEKVKKIASYSSNCFLTGNTSLSFSDADMNFIPDYYLQSFLHQKLPYEVPFPHIRRNLCDSNTKWINYYRATVWQDSDEVLDTNKKSFVYSSCANQLIVCKEKYSFAFKGGNNDEPHNHNDLGSFIYSDEDGQVFCDLGSGRYTKDYFDNSKRYGIFCNSSLSHNVPVIGGKPQPYGKEYTAKITCGNNIAVCNMSDAYDEKKLISFVRKAEIKENGIKLTDSFDFTEAVPVTERFVSLRKAKMKDNALVLGRTRLVYPADKALLSMKEEKHTPHEYDKEDVIVYCYDFALNEGVNEIVFEIIAE